MDPQDPGDGVLQEIQSILADPAERGTRLVETLAALGAKHDRDPFRLALHSLTHLERSEPQARSLFEAIEQHRAGLESLLGRDPGLAVATLDLLHAVEGILRDPVFRSRAASEPPRRAESEDRAPVDSFDDSLAYEVRRATRLGRPVALLVLGPDGPAEAAPALMASSSGRLRELCRDSDREARVLPDGFALALPCTSGRDALAAAGRLLQALQAATGCTWSAGLSCCPELAVEPSGLASGARRALQAARDEGGNVARMFRPERRAHPRRRPDPRALTAQLRWNGIESTAEVGDLSLGGARLNLAMSIAPEARITVAVRETSARPREAVLVSRVVRSDEAPAAAGSARFNLGVSFLERSGDRFQIAALLADFATESKNASRPRT